MLSTFPTVFAPSSSFLCRPFQGDLVQPENLPPILVHFGTQTGRRDCRSPTGVWCPFPAGKNRNETPAADVRRKQKLNPDFSHVLFSRPPTITKKNSSHKEGLSSGKRLGRKAAEDKSRSKSLARWLPPFFAGDRMTGGEKLQCSFPPFRPCSLSCFCRTYPAVFILPLPLVRSKGTR